MSSLKDFIDIEKENKIVFGGENNRYNTIVNICVPLLDLVLETYKDFKTNNISSKLAKIKINNLYKEISKSLSDRFGFTISIKSFEDKVKIIESFTVNNSYENLYSYKNEILDNNKVDSFLSFIKDNKRVTKSKESLKSTLKALDTSGVNVDLKNVRISGIDLFLNTYLNLGKCLDLELKASEVFSLIFYEIGKVFVNTQNLYKQIHLVSSISNELMKDNFNIEKVKIVSEKYFNKPINENDIVYVFNDLIVNYQDKVMDDYNKENDLKKGIVDFLITFNLSNGYIDAVNKIDNVKNSVDYYSINKEVWDIAIVSLVTIITSLLFLVFAFILVPVILAMGLLKIGLSLIVIIIKVFLNLMKFILGQTFGNKDKILDVLNDLKMFKRDFIARLRNVKDKENRNIILNNIKYLDFSITKFSNLISYEKDKKLKDTNEMNIDYKVNKLKDNDLQYLSETI